MLEDALGGELVEEPRQRPLGGVPRDPRLEEEQPDQRFHGAAAGGTPQSGHRLVAGEGVVGLCSEHLGHPVVREPGARQGVVQAGGQVGVVTPRP